MTPAAAAAGSLKTGCFDCSCFTFCGRRHGLPFTVCFFGLEKGEGGFLFRGLVMSLRFSFPITALRVIGCWYFSESLFATCEADMPCSLHCTQSANAKSVQLNMGIVPP